MMDDAQRAAMREAFLVLRPQLSFEHHLDALEAIYELARSAATVHPAES